jgi:hypothetical protein
LPNLIDLLERHFDSIVLVCYKLFSPNVMTIMVLKERRMVLHFLYEVVLVTELMLAKQNGLLTHCFCFIVAGANFERGMLMTSHADTIRLVETRSGCLIVWRVGCLNSLVSHELSTTTQSVEKSGRLCYYYLSSISGGTLSSR